jgi:hypothetical protein
MAKAAARERAARAAARSLGLFIAAILASAAKIDSAGTGF